MAIRIFNIALYYSMCVSLYAFQTAQGEEKPDSLSNNLLLFSTLNPQEKVYLHFDNTDYFMRESIWYKANIVDAKTLTANISSRILYVDLLNQEGLLVKRNRHYIEEGMCSGSFHLPDTLNAGYYEVRAYTAWMLNFGRIPNAHLIRNILHEDGSLLSELKNVEKRTSEVPCIR